MDESKNVIIKLKDGSKIRIYNAMDYWVNYEDRVAVVAKIRYK